MAKLTAFFLFARGGGVTPPPHRCPWQSPAGLNIFAMIWGIYSQKQSFAQRYGPWNARNRPAKPLRGRSRGLWIKLSTSSRVIHRLSTELSTSNLVLKTRFASFSNYVYATWLDRPRRTRVRLARTRRGHRAALARTPPTLCHRPTRSRRGAV